MVVRAGWTVVHAAQLLLLWREKESRLGSSDMHGVIVTNFKRYLDEFMGTDAWGEVVSTAGLQGKT